MTRADPAAVAEAFRLSCLDELRALKPGNVHIHAAGHGMTAAQFEAAAEAAAPAIGAPGLTVGERIEAAVEASWAACGCNTNLGIVLLTAPLAQAVLTDGAGPLPDRLTAVLDGLTIADAEAAYRAIRLANPGGLGTVAEHDVATPPSVTLRAAMAAARDRDCIARQYDSAFADVFGTGVSRLRELRHADPVTATEAAYMAFLAAFPDSHIARKFGEAAAESVRIEAARLADSIDWQGDPAVRRALLAGFDAALKAGGLNPGTSADLTVASLLAIRLEAIVSRAG